MYLVLTTLPSIFQGRYHESIGIAGLHYIAIGVGLSVASQINARMLDAVYKYFKEKNGGVGKPEYRLRTCIFFDMNWGGADKEVSEYDTWNDHLTNRAFHLRMVSGEACILDRTRYRTSPPSSPPTTFPSIV